LSLRKKYILPPFSQIISIEYRNINQNTVKTTIETYFNKIKRTIEKNNLNDKFILTPISPSFHEKISNLYHYNFEIKMKLNDPFSISQTDIKMRNQLLNLLPSDFYIDVDPIN
jgi:primosomal protein N'